MNKIEKFEEIAYKLELVTKKRDLSLEEIQSAVERLATNFRVLVTLIKQEGYL